MRETPPRRIECGHARIFVGFSSEQEGDGPPEGGTSPALGKQISRYYRDAINAPNSLPFIAVLDLLSGEELECVAPGLHRGWEDRRFSCRRSRVTACEALGITLEEGEREQLLLLAAYRNRIFRSPPPVRVVREEILAANPALNHLVQRLK